MILKGIEKKENVVILDYEATWEMAQDVVFDAAQVILETDYQEDLQRFITVIKEGEETVDRLATVKEEGKNIFHCDFVLVPTDVVVIAGKSSIMETTTQFAFYVNSNQVRLFVFDPKYFETNGQNAFDHYMSSIEINAYCKHTERKVRSSME